MDYKDILNTNAYLRSLMKENVKLTQKLTVEQQKIKTQEIDKKIDVLTDKTQSAINKALRLAESKNIKVENIEKHCIEENTNETSSRKPCINIPDGFDLESEFDELCRKASENEFTDEFLWNLLSEDDIKNAEKFGRDIDETFTQKTKLRKKDFSILFAAFVIRVICYYFTMYKIANSLKIDTEMPTDMLLDNSKLPVDAMSGVDLSSLIQDTQINPGLALDAVQVAGEFVKQPVVIKSNEQILNDAVPFDIPDNDKFLHDDIMGYDPNLGWLFGVLNIMTDTVTTQKLKTFSVSREVSGDLKVDDKISLLDFLYPIITSTTINKESMLAAVVREAQVLNIAKGEPEELKSMLVQTMEAEEKRNGTMDFVAETPITKKINILDVLPHFAYIGFVNQLITAVHAILFDPTKDGDIDTYSIRTNKIILISGTMATLANSVPAFVERDVSKLDIAGIIDACFNVFKSKDFWVKVKSNYLASEYTNVINNDYKKINKYFAQ